MATLAADVKVHMAAQGVIKATSDNLEGTSSDPISRLAPIASEQAECHLGMTMVRLAFHAATDPSTSSAPPKHSPRIPSFFDTAESKHDDHNPIATAHFISNWTTTKLWCTWPSLP
ncbi:hypothetical protein PG996_006954 [Apiospora saccharicola]|uniref:Uncharacterized protein n=1 Tax=Apiospora saccharicola TaxID=335842 RepID=A0ABR1V9H4_9PEZI